MSKKTSPKITPPKTITLDEFAAAAKARIDLMVSHWKSQHEKDPDNWPMSYSMTEWDDQFQAWEEMPEHWRR